MAVEMEPMVITAEHWPVPPLPKDVEKFYGKFKYEELSGGNVRVVGDWERDNIVMLRIKVRGPRRYRKVQVHRKLAQMFEELMEEIFSSCPDYSILQLGGYCPRHKMHDPRRGLSIHSWGGAVDINWETNPVSRWVITDFPDELIQVFESAGWSWGGRWTKLKDAMHFEFTKR